MLTKAEEDKKKFLANPVSAVGGNPRAIQAKSFSNHSSGPMSWPTRPRAPEKLIDPTGDSPAARAKRRANVRVRDRRSKEGIADRGQAAETQRAAMSQQGLESRDVRGVQEAQRSQAVGNIYDTQAQQAKFGQEQGMAGLKAKNKSEAQTVQNEFLNESALTKHQRAVTEATRERAGAAAFKGNTPLALLEAASASSGMATNYQGLLAQVQPSKVERVAGREKPGAIGEAPTYEPDQYFDPATGKQELIPGQVNLKNLNDEELKAYKAMQAKLRQ